jgi:phytoene desaturase
MKKIKGPNKEILIVGAGLGGLSAAIHLVAKGHKVTIVEKEGYPGGRNGIIKQDGFAFDNGPTVLTMPSLIEELFTTLGEKMVDWLELRPLNPVYRTFHYDGSEIDIFSNPAQMAAEIKSKASASEAKGYEDFISFCEKLYRYEMDDFIDRNIDTPFNLLTPNLFRLLGIGGFSRLANKVGKYFKDHRLQKAFSFQAMYAGVSPQDALAIYAVISYMDCVAGVYFPKGGMHAVPRALAEAAIKHGVDIKYKSMVTGFKKKDKRIEGAILASGEIITADAFILNPDLPYSYQNLLGENKPRLDKLKYSPSCAVLLLGATKEFPEKSHHNIHFGKEWDKTFDELIDQGKLMSDPSFLVTIPTKDDPELAPPGLHSYYVLFPTPNLSADIDWNIQTPIYRDYILEQMEKNGYEGITNSIVTEKFITPLEWERMGMKAGTPFAASHTFLQTGPFRPSNISKQYENLVFVGSGTQPGVGIPMVLISGKLAAQRI